MTTNLYFIERLYDHRDNDGYATEADAVAKAQKVCNSDEIDVLVTKALKKVVYPIVINEVVDLA